MTGLRTVGGALISPYSVSTNLFDNPMFRRANPVTEMRRNLAIDPEAMVGGYPVGGFGWQALWYGAAPANGTTSLVKNAADGPTVGPGQTLNSYIRKQWTTGGPAGDTGFAHSQRPTDGNNLYMVTVGDTYTASSWVRVNASGKTAGIRVRMYSSSNAAVADTGGATTETALTPNTWTRVSQTFTIPANVASIAVWTDSNTGTWAVGDIIDGTGLLVEKTYRLGTYFDGRTPAAGGVQYVWAGTGVADQNQSAAQAQAIQNVQSSRAFLYRPDPTGGAVQRSNGVTTSNDIYASPGGDVGAMQLGMQAGHTYTASVEGMASASDPNEYGYARTVSIWWRDSTGTYVIGARSTAVPVGNTFARVSVTATIPVGATEAFVRLYNGSYLRDVTWSRFTLVEGTGSTHIDGDQPQDALNAYRWQGAVDNSLSEKITSKPLSAFKPDGSDFAQMQKVLPRTNLMVNPRFANTSGSTVEVRRNLCINPSAESTSMNWPSNNGTLYPAALDTSNKRSGTQSVKAVGATTQTCLISLYNIGGGTVPVAPGDVITGSVYVAHNAATTAYAYVQLQFLDSSNTYMSSATVVGTSVTGIVGDSQFTARPSATATAPTGAASCRLLVYVQKENSVNVNAGEFGWADDALLEKTGTVNPYFDGSTPAANGLTYAWTGTTSASASTATGKVLTPGSFGPVRGVGFQYSPGSDGATGFCGRAYCNASAGGMSFRWTYPLNGVTPGQPYSFSGLIRSSLAGQFLVQIQWYDSKGITIATPAGQQTSTIPANTWAYMKWENVTAPPGATSAQFWFGLASPNPVLGQTMDVDQIIIEKTTTVGPFFSGSTPADPDYTYAWSGTVDNSNSTASP